MKPLILDYKTSRIEVPLSAPYRYSRELGLNVISVNDQEIPFIELKDSVAETMTKTKAEAREGDESHHLLLELTTKTLASREVDDVRNMDLLELMTKTRAQRERDDEHFIDN